MKVTRQDYTFHLIQYFLILVDAMKKGSHYSARFYIKYCLAVILFLLVAVDASAQRRKNKEDLVLKAQTEYDAGKYEDALATLVKAREQLDTTTADIEYLVIKSSHQLKRYTHAQLHLKDYFALEADTTLPRFQEMRTLSAELKKSQPAATIENGADTAGLVGGGFTEEETWQLAYRTNNIKAYRNYLRFYPEGPHAKEAKKFVDFEDKKNNSPSKLIVSAVKRGDWKLINELIENGADVNYMEAKKATIKKANGNAYEYTFDTPLSVALMKFDYTMVKFLLDQGADPNRLVYRKVYDYAYDYKQEEGRTRTILESMIVATSKYGMYRGRDAELIDFIDIMLKHGLDINFYQGSPLATAVYFHDAKNYKRTLLIRYLLRKGADPRLKGPDIQDRSAIEVARQKGDKKLVAILKDKKYKEARKNYQAKMNEYIKQQLNPEP
jgi:hypothetical protein